MRDNMNDNILRSFVNRTLHISSNAHVLVFVKTLKEYRLLAKQITMNLLDTRSDNVIIQVLTLNLRGGGQLAHRESKKLYLRNRMSD